MRARRTMRTTGAVSVRARAFEAAQIAQSARPRRAGRWRAAVVTLAAASCALAPAAGADEYEPQRAGHPVRIIAYALHPVGVVLDLLIFRPAHWIGSLPGLDEFFGHEPYED